jgi:peptide/nickel transport system substrate-binding protein
LRKLAAVVLALGLAAMGLSACGSGGKEGGTLKVSFAAFPDYLDPQLSYLAEGWSAMYNTYIPLLTYAHAEGEAGSQVIPGLATSMPKITNGEKTYTLTLRKGLKYSDGTPVKASDFKSSIERVLSLESGGSGFYLDIVGAEDFLEGKADSIPGIETNDATGEIVINLLSPRGTFTNELAIPFAAVVPASTPDKPQTATPPPATGPYEIVKVKPGRSWSYIRNPQWDKNNAALLPDLPGGHVDKIEATVVSNQATQVNDVEQGKTNWMFDPLPADRVAEVTQRYEGKQYLSEPSISTYFFWMNTKQPPFDDLKVRQAVNYALDPAALERINSGQVKGTQQILPPGMPGYEKYSLYPHDMAKAKALIKEANPSDRDITVWTDSLSPNDAAGEYYEALLDELGFNAKLKIVNAENYFSIIGNLSTPDLDTGWANFFEDYPHPNDFFQPLLAGSSILPTNSSNFAQFDDPAIDKKIEELREEQLGPQQEREYAQLDKESMEQAPWAPYGNRTLSLFVSSDISLDDVIWNPTFSGDLTSFQFK